MKSKKSIRVCNCKKQKRDSENCGDCGICGDKIKIIKKTGGGVTEGLMTEQQFITKFKKRGFVLIKQNPNNKKIDILFKIQKLVKNI